MDYDSGGLGFGPYNADVYITQDSNSISGGGGRGPGGFGGYMGHGKAHNFYYNMTR